MLVVVVVVVVSGVLLSPQLDTFREFVSNFSPAAKLNLLRLLFVRYGAHLNLDESDRMDRGRASVRRIQPRNEMTAPTAWARRSDSALHSDKPMWSYYLPF